MGLSIRGVPGLAVAYSLIEGMGPSLSVGQGEEEINLLQRIRNAVARILPVIGLAGHIRVEEFSGMLRHRVAEVVAQDGCV